VAQDWKLLTKAAAPDCNALFLNVKLLCVIEKPLKSIITVIQGSREEIFRFQVVIYRDDNTVDVDANAF